MATQAIDEAKLEQFMGQFVQDFGGAATAPMVLIGDKLGLYKAMADGEPVTPGQRVGILDARDVRRLLRAQECGRRGHLVRPPEPPGGHRLRGIGLGERQLGLARKSPDFGSLQIADPGALEARIAPGDVPPAVPLEQLGVGRRQ